jgi:hypothetical protein
VFGLHINAGITRDLQCTKQFLDSVLLVHGEGIAAQGEGRKSEACLGEITEDILYKVSMPEVWLYYLSQF